MAKMCFCDSCGRSIDSSFLFCPWCGKSTIEKGSMEILAENIEENNRRKKIEKIEDMERQLDELERELSVLVLSAEMAR